MAAILSTEALKSALTELVRSDKDFLLALLQEVLRQERASKEIIALYQPIGQTTIVNAKIKPPYRPKNIEHWRQQFAVDKSVFLQLRPLFADAPPAEEMIHSIAK